MGKALLEQAACLADVYYRVALCQHHERRFVVGSGRQRRQYGAAAAVKQAKAVGGHVQVAYRRLLYALVRLPQPRFQRCHPRCQPVDAAIRFERRRKQQYARHARVGHGLQHYQVGTGRETAQIHRQALALQQRGLLRYQRLPVFVLRGHQVGRFAAVAGQQHAAHQVAGCGQPWPQVGKRIRRITQPVYQQDGATRRAGRLPLLRAVVGQLVLRCGGHKLAMLLQPVPGLLLVAGKVGLAQRRQGVRGAGLAAGADGQRQQQGQGDSHGDVRAG
ncbi:hypothetical protein QF022_003381 [Vogesella perlucida]|nr:hypothetical protein [Vogesella perlucida]